MHFFKDRSLFYSTFPLREQGQKGVWDFRLLPVYFIAILDFIYDEKEDERKFRRDVCLKDQDGDVFYDKLHFKFLQMPLFKKQEHELETHFDKWVYFLKHLEDMDHIPAILNEPVFQKGFDIAEVSHLSSEQYDDYLKSVFTYNEAKAVTDTAFADGEKAKALEVAKTMIAKGFDAEMVAEITGLALKEVKAF
jgi:predicted transposase/invertase (TIGR01784 family)